jgi:hypothetical protein
MNDLGDISKSLKQVFISQKNTGYLFDLIVSKILKINPQYQSILFSYINKYKENIIHLQELIYNDSFINIYNIMQSYGKVDLEELLIELNKITVLKFEQLLISDLTNKFTSSSDKQTHLPTQSTYDRTNSEYSGLQLNNNTNHTYDVNDTNNLNYTNDTNALKKQDEVSSVNSEDSIQTISTEFFSENAIFEDGKYTFLLKADDICSINIDNIKIKWNIYNITENNNKFTLIESGIKTDVIIPIGYYDVPNLIDMISECTNEISINKNKDYFYKVFFNTFKNKICFLCDYVDKDRVTKPISFGISFYKSKNSNDINLYEMLGFYKTNYINNNLYVAENFPNTNIYDEIYCKLYLDNKELPKHKTSDVNFYFFEKINTDIDKSFGKMISTQFDDNFYTFDTNVRAKTLIIKFFYNYTSIILSRLWFKCKITFEHYK